MGDGDGCCVGDGDGCIVGDDDGCLVGNGDGFLVGNGDGCFVGNGDGCFVGDGEPLCKRRFTLFSSDTDFRFIESDCIRDETFSNVESLEEAT